MIDSQKNFSFLETYIKGEALIGGWRIVGNGLTLINTFILLSFLEVFDYGVYILIIAFYSFVSHLSLSLLQGVVLNDLIRFIGEGKESHAKRLFFENTSIQLGVGLVLSIATFFGADLIAHLYDKDVALLIQITSPLFFINALHSTTKMPIRARLYFGIVASRPVVYRILRLIFFTLFIFFASLNVQNALIIHVFASFLSLFVLVPSFVKTYHFHWKRIKASKEKILWRIVKTYGKWSLFGESFKSSILDMKPWLIKFFVNTEAVAIYSIAETLYGALKKLLPNRTLKVLIPRIVHDRERTEKIMLYSVKYLFISSVLLSVLGVVVFTPFILLLFPNYSDSIPLFYILLLALPFLSFRSPARAFIVALRRQRFIFMLGIIVSINSLVIPLIFLPLFGVVGMAIERVISAIIVSAITFWYLTREGIPLTLWRGIFKFDKLDKEIITGSLQLLQGWIRKKILRRH